ncbi:MAG: hypothetical protein WBQ21_07870 [Solirubrobacteraceae bacterium]
MAKFARRMMVPIVAALTLWCAVPALAASTKARWMLGGTPVTESTSTTWKGTFTLVDSKVPLLGSQKIACEDEATGSVSPTGAGGITKWTSSNCSGTIGSYVCEKSRPITAEAMHLPWHTELVLVEGAVRDVLVGAGKEPAGFKMKCYVDGGAMGEDSCSGTLSPTTNNVSGGVTAVFNASEKLNCAQGGSGSGTLEGGQTLESGSKLSVQTEEQPVWLLRGTPMTESKPVEWKGTISLEDKSASIYGSVGVECKDTAKGSVGPSAAGGVTEWAMSGCKPMASSVCESNANAVIEGRNLSWATELADISGVTRNLLNESDETIPTFELKCDVEGEISITECLRIPGTAMSNIGSGYGVSATFSSERITCSHGGVGAGVLEGSQTIRLTSLEQLEVS